MSRQRSAAVGRALLAFGAVVVIASGLVLLAPGAPPAHAVAADLGIELSATADLTDGHIIEVTVTAPEGTTFLEGTRGYLRMCREAATYDRDADLYPGAGNCPDTNISGAGSTANLGRLYPMPGGRTAIGTYVVGVGTAVWGPENGFELTCDSTNPCQLVASIDTNRGHLIDSSTILRLTDASPLGSCGGTRDEVLESGGPDRFIDQWASWTRDDCAASGEKAATNAVFAGEGLGLEGFHDGSLDVAYSGTGSIVPGREPAEARAAVSVPIGMNAAVFAMVGGYLDLQASDWPANLRRPFDDIGLTVDELAVRYGQGPQEFRRSPQLGAVIERNPWFDAGALGAIEGFTGPVTGPAQSDVASYLATRWFDTRAASHWRDSTIIGDGDARGVDDELATATPPFEVGAVEMYSARATLKKLVSSDLEQNQNRTSVKWVLMDLATAEQLGVPVAKLRNSRGEFVAPTTESLAAALETMERRPDGSVVSDGSEDAPGAYPLAFVEHVVVSAERDDCGGPKRRAVVDWVDYLTGPGQEQLVGVRPLTGDLEVAAASAKTALAEACEPKGGGETPSGTTTPPATPDTPGGVGSPPGGAVPDAGAALGDVGGSGVGGGASVPGGGDAPTADDPDSETDADSAGGPGDEGDDGDAAAVDLPPLAGRPGSRAGAGVAALVGLACMGAGAGSLGVSRRRLAEGMAS